MDYMARALMQASRVLGTCSPNPAVGAVLVRDGSVVGEGATQPPGQAHAEIVALRAAGPRAEGATLYVTLEPCSHFGRTAPCTDAIVEAGIAEVHLALVDPSPWVNGRGVAALEQAGIRVSVGEHEAEARRLNEAYLTWVLRGRPFVTAVHAIGLDGQPRPLSDPALDRAAQADLNASRARADLTVTSISDLLLEDPTLARLASAGVTALNVECGPAELRGLVAAGLLDRVRVFVLPILSPGAPLAGGLCPTGLAGNAGTDAPLALTAVSYERFGETVRVSGDIAAPGASRPPERVSVESHAGRDLRNDEGSGSV